MRQFQNAKRGELRKQNYIRYEIASVFILFAIHMASYLMQAILFVFIIIGALDVFVVGIRLICCVPGHSHFAHPKIPNFPTNNI